MKNLLILTTVSIILFSCNKFDKAKNIKIEHLYAFLYNNGYSELQIYKWYGEEKAVFSNDEYILTYLNNEGFFIGAQDRKEQYLSILNKLHYNVDLIGQSEQQTTIEILTNTSKMPYGYFAVKKVKEDDFENNNFFECLPITRTYGLQVDTFYFNAKINDLIKSFNEKIANNSLTTSDTTISKNEVDDLGEDAIINNMVLLPSKGYTTTKNGAEYYHPGKSTNTSKFVGCFSNGNQGMYIADDIRYEKSLDSEGVFPIDYEVVMRTRVRKFDNEGNLDWSFCTMPCKKNSAFKDFNHLFYLGMYAMLDTVYLFLIEESNSSISSIQMNALIIENEFSESKVLVKLDEKTGKLINISYLSNDEYSTILRPSEGYYHSVTGFGVKNHIKDCGEKFENHQFYNSTTNALSSEFEVEIKQGKNIENYPFIYYAFEKDGKKGFGFFKNNKSLEECICSKEN